MYQQAPQNQGQNYAQNNEIGAPPNKQSTIESVESNIPNEDAKNCSGSETAAVYPTMVRWTKLDELFI